MELLIIGIATAFNFMIIKWKLEKHRFADAVVDVAVLLIVGFIFGGTLGGMTIAMVASAIVSLYLLWSPPVLPDYLRKFDNNK